MLVRSLTGPEPRASVVFIPDANTVFAGDLFWRNIFPNTIDASTKAWIATLDTLAKNGMGYTFVPGHGEVGNAQDVTAFRDYLMTLQRLVSDARASGKTGDAVTEAVMPALLEKYGHWEYSKYLAPRNIVEADLEQSGKKRIPQASSVK